MSTHQPQSQSAEQQNIRPGKQAAMKLQPATENSGYKGSDKLQGKVAIVTGGDSGIGQAVAVAFAKEGADIAVVYLNEHEDAAKTKQLVEAEGRQCIVLAGDIGDESFCHLIVKAVYDEFGHIDVLINNAGEQHPQEVFEDITAAQLEKTFRTNIFSMFFLTKAILPHMGEGSTIVNTASVTAYKGQPMLVDYAATKGAIVAFTRSLALNVVDRGIRVNAVAPGPIWTPLITSTFPPDKVKEFGKDTPMKRPGQPEEVATAFVYLASDDSSYVTGQTVHVNGGSFVDS